MATSNAERQAAYRARKLKGVDADGAHLNLIVNFTFKLKLERLASAYGLTQKAMLERVLLEAERVAIDQAARYVDGQQNYYDKKLKLNVTA